MTGHDSSILKSLPLFTYHETCYEGKKQAWPYIRRWKCLCLCADVVSVSTWWCIDDVSSVPKKNLSDWSDFRQIHFYNISVRFWNFGWWETPSFGSDVLRAVKNPDDSYRCPIPKTRRENARISMNIPRIKYYLRYIPLLNLELAWYTDATNRYQTRTHLFLLPATSLPFILTSVVYSDLESCIMGIRIYVGISVTSWESSFT